MFNVFTLIMTLKSPKARCSMSEGKKNKKWPLDLCLESQSVSVKETAELPRVVNIDLLLYGDISTHLLALMSEDDLNLCERSIVSRLHSPNEIARACRDLG